MSREEKRIAFLKSLVAAAWADGELNPSEIRTLTEYLRRLDISGEEYEELKPLLERPMRPEEAHHLLEAQLAKLSTRDEQGALLAAVEDLFLSDDSLAEAEAQFLTRLREMTRNPTTPHLFVNQLRNLWRGAPPPERARVEERHLQRSVDEIEDGAPPPATEQFYRRRLLEYFRHTLALARAKAGQSVDSEIPDPDLYRVAIWAALLSAVAHADTNFCPAEEEELLALLKVGGHVPDPDLRVVIDAYRSASLEQFDLGWLVREFLNIATPEEGSRLLDCLFLVAAADGELHSRELAVIREIATRLGFPDVAFQTALTRCKGRMQRGWN